MNQLVVPKGHSQWR